MSQSHSVSMEELPEDQDWLIDRMQKLGYRSNKGGICFGESLMWTQALLVGQVDAFNKRLRLLNSLTPSELKALQNTHRKAVERIKPKIDELRKQARKNALDQLGFENEELNALEIIQLNELLKLENNKIQAIRLSLLTEKERQEENTISDIEGFFEGIEVFLQGHQYYAELYDSSEEGVPLAQDAARVSKIIKSKQLEHSSMVEIGAGSEFSRPYSVEDLLAYFESFRSTIEKNSIEYPISLVLGGAGHTIAVSYNAIDHSWLINDANKLSSNVFKSDKDIAKVVLKSLSDNEYAVFSTEVYVSSQHNEHAESCIKEWIKQMQLKDYSKQSCLDSRGTTWLHVAASKGHAGNVKKILETKGNSIYANHHRNDDGTTALHVAVREGRIDVVNQLLNAENIVPDIADTFGGTPLHVAALQKNRGPIIKALLAKMAENKLKPNAKDESGETALHIAVCQGDVEAVKILTKAEGIDCNIKRRDGKTALHIAAFNGNIEMIKVLLSQKDIDPNIQDADGETPLYQAARQGHPRIAALILKALEEKDYNPNVQRKDGETPLYIAARQGHLSVLNLMFLSSCKVEPNIKRKDGKTALHIATLQGRIDVVRFLAKASVDPNVIDDEGNTPLHIAVRSCNFEMVVALLESNKCDPNKKNQSGESALSIAMRYSRIDILQVLIDRAKTDLVALKLVMNWNMTKSKETTELKSVACVPFGVMSFSDAVSPQTKVSSLQAGTLFKTSLTKEKIACYTRSIESSGEVIKYESQQSLPLLISSY